MSTMTYSTAGSYTDTTNEYQLVVAADVNLNSGLGGGDVFVDNLDNITATADFINVFAGNFSLGSTITLNGSDDGFYGGIEGAVDVTANGYQD